MKCCIYLIALLATTLNSFSQCKLQGTYVVREGRLLPNYEKAPLYTSNRLIFEKDSVFMASGFFFNVDDVNADPVVGRSSYVYYGNKEAYRIVGDSLWIRSNPYKRWNKFKIICENGEVAGLVSMGYSAKLTRLTDSDSNLNLKDCKIKAVRLTKGGGDYGNRSYVATLERSDTLVYEGGDPKSPYKGTHRIRVRPGTFEYVCSGLTKFGLKNLRSFYPTDEYHFTTLILEITLTDGTPIKSVIRSQRCPDEILFSIIPILHGYEYHFYGRLKPVDFPGSR